MHNTSILPFRRMLCSRRSVRAGNDERNAKVLARATIRNLLGMLTKMIWVGVVKTKMFLVGVVSEGGYIYITKMFWVGVVKTKMIWVGVVSEGG